MIPAQKLVVAVGGIALAAGLASGAWVQKQRLDARYQHDMKQMLEAGIAATEKRNVQIASLRKQAIEDADRIARLSRGARVRICPDAVPGGGNVPDADSAGTGGATGEDITAILRQCLRTFGEVNRALDEAR